jgi:O-antigen/teichoic acid export membrane protein
LLGLELQGSFVRAVGAFSFVRLTGGLVLFLSQILLARWMGRDAFGIYSYSWAWVAILASVANLGLGGTSVRFLAIYRNRNQEPRIRGLLRFGTTVSLACASAIALIGLLFSALATGNSPYLASMQIAFLAIPALALLTLDAAYARGFNWMAMSAVAEQIGRPLVLIVLGGLWVGTFGRGSAAIWVALCAGSYLVVTLAQHIIVRLRISGEIGAGPAVRDATLWWRVSFVMLLLNAAQMIRMNTDLVLVGAMLGPAEVGIYTAAVRVATLVSFLLVVASVVAQPRMAELHAQGRRDELRGFVRSSTRAILAVSLVIGGVLATFGERVLGVFGAEFVGGYHALLVLIVGHVLAAASGPLTSLLAMTGQHGRAAALHGVSTLTNTLLIVLLIPRFGIVGAALATSLNLALTQVALLVAARQRLSSSV